MGVITLELHPGKGLGQFTLGMPISDALGYVEQQWQLFENVEIKYSEEEPLQWDVVLVFPSHGFLLRFEPRTQRLRLIEIFDMRRMHLRYANSIIGGPWEAATFVKVYALFGPTFPGTYDSGRELYVLSYPGLSFHFPIPSQYAEICRNREAEMPLEFSDGTTPVMSRVCITTKEATSTAGGETYVGVAHAIPPPLQPGSLYLEQVQAKLAEGLHFTLGGQVLPFGLCPQDAWAELGRPENIYHKQVDTMVIHSGSDLHPRTALCGDYVYNYFTRGIDILFDGQTNRAKKFVLHTNFPGHADFNSYIKCNFLIICNPGDSEKGFRNGESTRCITPDTMWPEVQDILGDGGRAAIQTRGSKNNPFGPTYVYGYRHIAFEVMKNRHIASVTLFQA